MTTKRRLNLSVKGASPTAEIGYGGKQTQYGELRADEFLRELKGTRGVQKFREMRDNDATVGAGLYAIEQTLRDVGFKIKPSEADTTGEHAKFVEECFEDMSHSLDDHISEALSSLSYGFASFEVVYKRRKGKKSKFDDGKMGIGKLASRSQWTIQRFDVDPQSGDLLAIRQTLGKGEHTGVIPAKKLLHYRTTTTNNDWSGRSILRNAYKSYYYLSRMQDIEAIAIERDMHGIPIGRMPAEYLSPDANDNQKAVYDSFVKGIRDIKNNEHGAIVLPSDTYEDSEGKPSNVHLMTVELLSASGSRSIDMDKVIRRYQNDIARSLLAEFLMLGDGTGGSYALSKTKGDMFLKSLEAYLNTLYDTITRQLLTRLFTLNMIDHKYIPKVIAKDVAKYDLKELAAFLRNVNGAGVNIADHEETLDFLFNDAAEIPYDATQNTSTAEAEHTRNLEVAAAMPDKDPSEDDDPTKDKDPAADPEGKPKS